MKTLSASIFTFGVAITFAASSVNGQNLEGAVQVGAGVEPDPHGISTTIRPELGPHVLWAGDRLFRHSILFDGDTGAALGMLDTTWSLGGVTPHTSHRRGEFHVIEPIYSHGMRGERTDYVTTYDSETLAITNEIALPTLREEAGHGVALSALLDDERFLVIVNMIPAASVTVVDLDRRRFAAEIETAGCSLVYPAGPRRFGMLCGDGTALAVDLTDYGKLANVRRTNKFFDAVRTPVSGKGARDGTRWVYASFDGYLHEVDFGKSIPHARERWSLLSDSERSSGWTTGGKQHLAIHKASRRLYALVHKKSAGSHKDAGSEIWTYDLDSRERVGSIEVPSLLPAFLRPLLGLETDSWAYKLLGVLLPNLGAHSIVVTQDTEPLMFLRHEEVGAIGVVDVTTGEHIANIEEAGITGGLMTIP
jgi:methylamine dehydrogenase heavy chain